uniref:ArsR/SmtB family transcription factor n=1 Tax=Clostridium sp. 12(A) TaxID=1163671 RepID=UPI000466748C|nr:metalloregulator ArsR/SmtB family transcription factor [Clostridium sp. 12(A)]
MNHIELPHNHGEEKKLEHLKVQLSEVDQYQTVSDVFKQLGDTTRIRIFWLLCHCEECVINIAAMMEMSSPAISHHLRPLKNSGLIVSRRVGKEVYYRAAESAQSKLLHEMIEKVMEITCPK